MGQMNSRHFRKMASDRGLPDGHATDSATVKMVKTRATKSSSKYHRSEPQVSKVEASQSGLSFGDWGPAEYLPSANEIKRLCADIRSGWSAAERKQRREQVDATSGNETPFLKFLCSLRGI